MFLLPTGAYYGLAEYQKKKIVYLCPRGIQKLSIRRFIPFPRGESNPLLRATVGVVSVKFWDSSAALAREGVVGHCRGCNMY